MPKKTFQVDDFSGGVNSFKSPENLKNNEVVQSQGFLIEPGEVSVIGDMKGAYVGASGGSGNNNKCSTAENAIDIESGYGLAAFSHDYQADGGLASTKYVVIMDNITFDVWADSDTPDWVLGSASGLDLGTGSSGTSFALSVKPSYFIADGALRISPGYFDKKDTNANTNGTLAATSIYGTIQTLTTASTSNIAVGDTIIIDKVEMVVIAGSGTTWYVARNITGNFTGAVVTNPADIYTILDSRWRGFVNRNNFANATDVGTFSEWYSTYSTPRPPILWSDNVDDSAATDFPFTAALVNGTGDATVDGTNAPCVTIAYENAPTTANSDATWDGASVNLYITALYDEQKQESQPHLLTTSTFAIAAANDLLIWVGVAYALNAGAYLINKRVTGARLYYEDITNDPGILFQLLEIDFEKGCKKAGADKFSAWDPVDAAEESVACIHQDASVNTNRDDSDAAEVFIFSDPPKAFTYEINTGYPSDTTIHARYKTATICSRRLFVGNVSQNGKVNGDRMIGSPVNKFDILPETGVIDVAIGDGDEIVKLESYGHRILQFKKRILYIINVGGGIGGEYLESEYKNMGVQNPSQVCKTEYGVAWVNSKGVYIFDGKNLKDLTTDRLKLSSSTRSESINIDEDNIPLIGYHPTKKWLIIHPQSVVATDTNEDEAWIFNMKNGAWMYTTNFTADQDFKTNMVWAPDNELIFAAGTNSSNTPDFFKYQDSTAMSAPGTNALVFLTKAFDLDLPGVKKKIHSVSITYSVVGSNSSYIEADLIYNTAASGAATTVALAEEDSGSTYYTEALGFKGTSGNLKTVRLVPVSAVKGAYTFQLKLHNPDASYTVVADFKLHSVAFAYRVMGVR